MNETYIRRQLKLKTLDIPMSDDIQQYYDDFNMLFEILGKLEKEEESDESIIWSKGYNNIIIYDYIDCEFWSAAFFQNYFEVKYGLSHWEIQLILNVFLGYIFNLEVKVPKYDEDDIDIFI